MKAQWLFSGLFHGIAENPGLLQFVDTLTVIVLILLFYVANPPFIGYLSETTGEGHYLLVNKQLIEMVVLMLFVFLPKESFQGPDLCFPPGSKLFQR